MSAEEEEKSQASFVLTAAKKILIISEDLERARGVANQLNMEGVSLDSCESGIKGLNLCQRDEFNFIICDYKTKFMDGWRFVKAMKNNKEIPNMPVIMFSTDDELIKKDTTEKANQIREYGVMAILPYPLDRTTLQRSLDRCKQVYANKNSLEFAYTAAKKAMIEENVDASEKIMEKIYKNNVNSSRSNLGMTHVYKAKGDKAKVDFHLNKACEADKDNLSARYLQFQIAVEKKDLNRQISIPDELVKLDNNENTLIIFHLSEILFAAKGFKDVLRLYNKYKNFLEGDPPYYLDVIRSKCYIKLEQIDTAHGIISDLVDKKNDDSEVLNIMAVICRRRMEHEKAVEFYMLALEKSPTDYRLMYNLALVYAHLKDYDNALAYANRVIKIEPHFKNAHQFIANIKDRNKG